MSFKVNTLAMTKPDKAKTVEMHLCQMARSGQLQSKFTDEQLIALLERLSEQTKKKNVVNVIQNCFDFIQNGYNLYKHFLFKYDRRRIQLDSDSD